jgi:hypothetical protein
MGPKNTLATGGKNGVRIGITKIIPTTRTNIKMIAL